MGIAVPSATPAPVSVAHPVLGVLGAALTGLALAALALVVIATHFFGFQVLAIASGSMTPALKTGDLIVVRPASIMSANTGDIVLFTEGTQRPVEVAHRVAAVINVTTNITSASTHQTRQEHTRLLRTKGDANPQPDAQVIDASHFRGLVWFSVPGVGRLLSAGPLKLALIVVAALSGLFWATYEIANVLRRKRAA